MLRRPPAEVQQRWIEVFENPLLSTETFKATGTSGASSSCLRSVFWRVWLARLPLPIHSEAISTSQHARFPPAWAHYVHSTREEWDHLKLRYLSRPNASVASDTPKSPGVLQAVSAEADPLSQEENGAWNSWYEDQQLRRTIMLDVERSFPDNDFFRDPLVQETMANILQVWSKLNEYGYRQGIHELLGCVLEAIYLDAFPQSEEDLKDHKEDADSLAVCRLVLDARFVEHDSYAIFQRLMLQAGSFYDPTPSIPMPLSQSNSFKVEQPIVARLYRIINVLLATIDPALVSKLQTLEIEPQLFGLRWLRLLFTREFPVPDALELWDALFAEDTTLKLADFIVIAMLLRIRTELLDAEYSEALQLLLRYPQPQDGDYHIDALFHQAKLLRDNPTPSGASMVRQQNQALGFGGGATPRESRSPVSSMRRSSAGHSRSESVQFPFSSSLGSPRAFQYPNAGAFTDLARNVYARAESTGINKAIGDFARNFNPPTSSFSPTSSDFRNQSAAARHHQMRVTSENEALKRRRRADAAFRADCAAALRMCTSVLEQPFSDSQSSTEARLQLVLPVLRHLQDALAQDEEEPATLNREILDSIGAQLHPLGAQHDGQTPSSFAPSEATTEYGGPDVSESFSTRFQGLNLDRDNPSSSYPPLKGLRRRSLALSPPSNPVPLARSTSTSQKNPTRSPSSLAFSDPLGAL